MSGSSGESSSPVCGDGGPCYSRSWPPRLKDVLFGGRHGSECLGRRRWQRAGPSLGLKLNGETRAPSALGGLISQPLLAEWS